MSAEYDAYLSEHILNVQKAAQWMADNINYIITNDAETITIWTNLLEEVQSHDKSKYDHAEYDAYDYHFYGGGKDDAADVAFDYAWLHHQKKNPHHWQYWVLLKDEGEIVPLDMPLVYILEMIADWWSFSWKNGDLMEIFRWYNEHRDKMRLSLSTRIQVELILSEIHDILVTQLKRENPSFDPSSIIEHSSIKKDDDKEYGIPEQKKFPLPDADHVRSAIRFFNYVDPKYEQELADAINEKIAEYQMAGIHVGDENKFKKYVKEEYLEHHGILGQKWGVRRYQNPDGTLTEEGIYHYRKVRANQRKEDIDSVYNRLSKKEKALIGDDENAKEYLSTDEGEYVVKRLVDRSDDKPVAFLDMMTSTKPGELIVTVATDPDYRGQGRAEKLARKGIKWFDKNGEKYGFKYLDWGFYEENKSSQKVAEKVGFKFFKQDNDWIVYRYTTDPNIKHDDFDNEEDDDIIEHHGILGQKWGQRNGPPYPLNRNALDSYDKEKITEPSINKYKDQAKQLSHVRVNKDTNGTIFTDDGKLIGMVNVEAKDDGHRWIQGLELFGDGKGKGLSYDLLDYATDELGATHLSVNKANTIAKHVYDKYGFKTYDETDDMYFMKIDDHIEHHGILGQKWGIQNGPPYPIGSGGAADRSHYNNHTVFISGSSKTTTEDSDYYRKDLPESIQNELKRHMHEGNKIIVGDAPGIDRQVQDFLNENDYYNVEVYGPGKKVRYSANSEWKTNPIDAPEYEEGSKEWLAKKDLAMSKAANEGLAIILDEGATATRKNIRRLADDDKDVKVFSLGADGNDNWVPEKMIKEIT